MEEKKAAVSPSQSANGEITFEEFTKVRLCVARVLGAERVPETDKLVRMELGIGEERRQVVAGIADEYVPESLVGRQVVYVANLQARKLRGLTSQGMILAADGPNGEAILIGPDKEAPEGAGVH